MKLSNPFNNPDRNVYSIKQRSDFTQLISTILKDAFSKKLIRIENRSELTDTDLKSLLDTLKSKPKAVAVFKELSILDEFITQLPDMSAFHGLKVLYLNCCGFTSMPNLENLPNLEYFHFVPRHTITCAAPSLLNNKKLKHLILCDLNLISTLDLSNNNALEELVLVRCELQDVPSIENCTNLTTLTLRENKIKVPPKLHMHKKLTRLDLSENQMTEPPEVDACPLVMLNLNRNQLRRAPDKLPASLTWFCITHNLVEVPPDLTNCRLLENFSVQNNRLLDASDISKCGKLHNYSFRCNPLTLASKIYLMQFDLKKSIITNSFDFPERWREDQVGYYPDFKFLAQTFKSLPKAVRTRIRIESNFSHYEYHNYMLLMTILMAVKPLANWEEHISRKILSYLCKPTAWLDHTASMLKDAFIRNLRALEIIDYYTSRVEESDKETTTQIIEPRITTARVFALLHFKRLQQHNTSNPYNLPSHTQPINATDSERHNRITASHLCVIS